MHVELTLLAIGRGWKRYHTEYTWTHALGDRPDGAAFAGAVAALEDDNDALPGVLHPFLQLAEFGLKPL